VGHSIGAPDVGFGTRKMSLGVGQGIWAGRLARQKAQPAVRHLDFLAADNHDRRMKYYSIAMAILSIIVAVTARAKDRLPTIPPQQYTEEQKQAAADFESARKVPVFGPFEPLMYSPQLMSTARAMGDYLRYKSAIGNMLSELVILMTARECTQDYEWSLHYPIALKAGIRKEVADDIALGRRPTAMSPEEETVFDFTSELLRNKQVSDATFERAKSRLGMQGVVDMTGIVGYYTFLAMQLNVAQYPGATDVKKLAPLTR
jgi:4-carboxymuconolactone decarboxylase